MVCEPPRQSELTMSSFHRAAPRFLALLLAGIIPSAAVLAERTIITPPAFTGLLTNPGIGVASFHDGYGQKPLCKSIRTLGLNTIALLERSGARWKASIICADRSCLQRCRPASMAMNVGLRFMALDEPQSARKSPPGLLKRHSGQWVENGKTFVPDS